MTGMTKFLALAALAVGAWPLAAQAPASPVFESPKPEIVEQDGVQLDVTAAFTQSFQALSHSNTAAPNLDGTGNDLNALVDLGAGFNLANANLGLNAMLAPGLQVVLEAYLSSRHHPEAWVKGGYLQMDASPFAVPVLEEIMRYTTVRVGHFEVNYGDAHFRRSDNAQGIRNPFAENLVLDAFTTEIGGDVTVRKGSLLGMVGVTNGQINGAVTNPDGRSFAFLGKVGVDHTVVPGMRFRLTASTYQNDNAGRATLYGGDRAGSAYWNVMDNANGGQFTNGRVNPNFTEEIRAYQINPFIEFGPLELFGTAEWAKGRTAAETDNRAVTQYAGDVVYRFLDDMLYVAGRYNTVTGELFTLDSDQTVDRFVLGGGWFLTPNVLLKAEYVNQTYDGFPATHILNGGAFDGIMVQGVVAF